MFDCSVALCHHSDLGIKKRLYSPPKLLNCLFKHQDQRVNTNNICHLENYAEDFTAFLVSVYFLFSLVFFLTKQLLD